MKKFICLTILIPLLATCTSEGSKEKKPLMENINKKVDDVDANRGVDIYEDDFHSCDSIYKIRGYFVNGKILKLYSSGGERDDYFYFENNEPIFQDISKSKYSF